MGFCHDGDDSGKIRKAGKAIELLLKESPKNCYVISGNNRQVGRKDLPLYLPGNGSLLLAAAIMTAGYEGCCRRTPGFPDDGQWIVEFEILIHCRVRALSAPLTRQKIKCKIKLYAVK